LRRGGAEQLVRHRTPAAEREKKSKNRKKNIFFCFFCFFPFRAMRGRDSHMNASVRSRKSGYFSSSSLSSFGSASLISVCFDGF
jgi:hypothetical protein